jgi:hypothetical protein
MRALERGVSGQIDCLRCSRSRLVPWTRRGNTRNVPPAARPITGIRLRTPQAGHRIRLRDKTEFRACRLGAVDVRGPFRRSWVRNRRRSILGGDCNHGLL